MKQVPKRVLVTGATGFTGGALAKKLVDRGDQVVAAGRRTAAFLFSPQWSLVLFDPRRRFDDRVVRLRREYRSIEITTNDFDVAAGICRQQLLFRDIGVGRWSVCVCRQPTTRQHRHYPRSFAFDPTGQFLVCCNQRADNLAVFKVNQKTGGLKFTEQYVPVGNPSSIAFVELNK